MRNGLPGRRRGGGGILGDCGGAGLTHVLVVTWGWGGGAWQGDFFNFSSGPT